MMCVRSFVLRPSVRPFVRPPHFGSCFEQVLALLRWPNAKQNTQKLVKSGHLTKMISYEQVCALLRWPHSKYLIFSIKKVVGPAYPAGVISHQLLIACCCNPSSASNLWAKLAARSSGARIPASVF